MPDFQTIQTFENASADLGDETVCFLAAIRGRICIELGAQADAIIRRRGRFL